MEDFDNFDCFDVADLCDQKRAICDQCQRPQRVCWCQYLPKERLSINTKVIILQHPFEQSRAIQTAKILELALVEDKISVIRAKKFNAHRTPDLMTFFTSPSTGLLYPSKDAEDLCSPLLTPLDTLVVLDGTWAQAKSLYTRNPDLHNIRKVGLLSAKSAPSEFVIRQQPSPLCLSTVEAVARSLAQLEPNRGVDLETALCEPMRALCQTQLSHGAVFHSAKESGRSGRRVVAPPAKLEDDEAADVLDLSVDDKCETGCNVDSDN